MPTPSDGVPADLSDTVAVDRWLAALVGEEPGVCLLAVGSYGRRDHACHSDLDLALIHDGRRDMAAVADRIWYPIWDAGLGLDHSVRTPRQAIAVAAGDLKAALGLLDGRVVAGEAALGLAVVAEAKVQWRKKAKQLLPALVGSVRERHERFGEVAFLLEPNLKEGAGGLRDVAALRALAVALPEVEERMAVVDPAAEVLRRIRGGLHRRARRAVDRLALEEQDGLAAELGFVSADALMGAVSEAARAIDHVGQDSWRRIASISGRAWSGRWVRRLGGGLVVRDGEVVATNDVDLGDPALPLRVATEAARQRASIAREMLVAFERHTPVPPAPWPTALREALVALLAEGHDAIRAVEALDHHGLIVRLLPEWGAVRHRPQRNAYHRFTVDRHLLETAANAASGDYSSITRMDLLLVGALLHDIGKGFPGDHTVAGMAVVARVATRMGFDDPDVAQLVDMVRHHLLLADAATRRDIDDPATAAAVAAAVRSPEMLELLAALTTADGLATGPAAWSDWKAGLVRELVERTHAVLVPSPGLLPVGADEEWLDDAEGLDGGLHGQGNRCVVVADDRPGVLSVVAGVLALHGLDVLGARVGARTDGRAVEVIDVEPEGLRTPDWPAVARDVNAALDGRLPLEERLATRARDYASVSRRAEAATSKPTVTVDNRASDRATVVEVRARNSIGVLHCIAAVLTREGFDVRWASAASLGSEVIDSFYVVDAVKGDKVSDASRLGRLEEQIVSALTG